MLSFKQEQNESTQMRIIDLLPKKVKRMIYRHQHSDKYKAALLMMRALRKDPDVISRGLSKNKIKAIAADHFGLNHREFDKILNRQTRYEEAPPGMSDTVKKFKKDGMDDEMAFSLAWSIYNKRNETISEAYTIAYTGPADIKHIDYSDEQLTDIDKLYTKVKSKHDTPLIFDTNPKQKVIKFHTSIFDKELAANYKSIKVVKGTGSVKNVKSVELQDFGIATTTDFLEFFQCVGLQIGVALTPENLKKELKQLFIGGDFKIRSYISDWPKFVAYIDADKSVGKDVIMLVNGSYYYRQKININKPYVIWTGIDKYYTALKSKEGIEGSIKKNTADCVLIDGTEVDLYKALESKKPIITSDDGMLSCNGVKWYQISLKKADGQAKLGKITKFMKGNYEPDQSNWDLAKLTGLEKEFPDVFVEEYLQEGFFGDTAAKLKDLGGNVLANFKAAAKKVLDFGKGVFKKIKMLGKKYEKSTEREIDRLTKRSKYLKEDYLGEMSQIAKLNAIVDDPRINKSYTATIEKYRKAVDSKSNDVVEIMNTNNPRARITNDSVNFLVSNVISFQLLDDIIADVKKNGINVINDLNQSMAMGDTNLPVVKVYGNPDKADVEVITVGKIKQAAPKRDGKPISVLKVLIKPFNDYYTTNMWLFAEIVDDVAKYHKIAFKKSGSSAFNFNVEGTQTVPEDKIPEFK